MTAVHISRGVNVQYFGAFRRRSCRKFETIITRSSSRNNVVKETALKFANNPEYAEAVVAMVADYYDPVSVITMTRK